MPGIVGLITRLPRERAEAQLHTMVRAIEHEPFYTTGTWSDPSLGAYVGWTALERSFADGMPLVNERQDVVLAFSGEDFQDAGTVAALRARGHDVKRDVASYLVHMYEEDEQFPRALNGRFHGLVADRRRGTTALFNDRTGMHRLYVHEAVDATYFAAEAKAILAVRQELSELDVRSLGELISCGCVLENRTLFTGIGVLPGSQRWIFRQGSLQRKESYFEPGEWEAQASLEPDAYYNELRTAFARVLPRYFASQQRVGVSLTGGLDTRMIMAWHRAAPGFLPCYTFGGMLRDSRDVSVSRRVAHACGQPHEVISLGEEFLAGFPRYAERAVYLTDGCVEVTRAADLYVNARAREIAPVRVTGNYGGELLRRVRAFKPMAPLSGLFTGELAQSIEQAGRTYARLTAAHPLTFALFNQGPWHFYGTLALEQTQLSMRSPFLDNELLRIAYRGPAQAFQDDRLCLRLIAEGNAELRGVPTDRGAGGGRLGRRARRTFQEFLFKAEYAYDYGMPQPVAAADHALRALRIERLFLGRHKFYHYRVWYRDYLAEYVGDMLLDRRTLSRPYIDRKAIIRIVDRHLKGDRNYTTAIHKLLTLELIQRQFVDANRAAAVPALAS